jgi:predicted HicB family RNase H-like nuclease
MGGSMIKQKFLAIRIDTELHHKIKLQALLEKLSIQEWIEKLIKEKIDQL